MALIELMSEPSYPFMQSSWSTQQECFAVGGTGVRLTHGDKEHDAIQSDHRPRPCRGLVFGHGICQRDGRDFGILDIALRLQGVQVALRGGHALDLVEAAIVLLIHRFLVG